MATAAPKSKGRYNPEKIKQQVANRNRKLTKGLYQIECVAAANNTPKEPEYNLTQKLVWALMKEDGTVSNSKVTQFNLCLPINNDQVKDHEAPDWASNFAVPQVQACFPDECPLYPAKDPKTKKMMFNGEEIDPGKDSVEEHKEIAEKAAMDQLDILEQNPELWVGRRAYVEIEPSPPIKKNGQLTGEVSDFPELRRWRSELKTGQAVVPDANWYSGSADVGTKTAGEKANRFKKPAEGAAAPAGKAPAKKAGNRFAK